jgi:hypothetical protein
MDTLKAKVIVTADSGETVEDTVEITKKSDIELAVRSTLSLFKIQHQTVPPFGLTIRIDHA